MSFFGVSHGGGDDRVTQVFLTAIDAAGGPRQFVERGTADWLPELLESSYIIVLQEEENRSPDEIADMLGVTRATVESVLSAPTEHAVTRLADPLPDEASERNHVAGGAAKFAYGVLRRESGEPGF